MIIAQVLFGQTHAILSEGDLFKGKQTIKFACAGDWEKSKANQDRVTIYRDQTSDKIACAECRRALKLDEDNADDSHA